MKHAVKHIHFVGIGGTGMSGIGFSHRTCLPAWAAASVIGRCTISP